MFDDKDVFRDDILAEVKRTDKAMQYLNRVKLAEGVKQRIHAAILNKEFNDVSVEEVVYGYFEGEYFSANKDIKAKLEKYGGS